MVVFLIDALSYLCVALAAPSTTLTPPVEYILDPEAAVANKHHPWTTDVRGCQDTVKVGH